MIPLDIELKRTLQQNHKIEGHEQGVHNDPNLLNFLPPYDVQESAVQTTTQLLVEENARREAAQHTTQDNRIRQEVDL